MSTPARKRTRRSPGLYVRREAIDRDDAAGLFVEAAYLTKQPGAKARAWSMIAGLLAVRKLVELDEDEEVRAIAIRILRERRRRSREAR